MTFLIVHCAPSGLESPPTNVVNSTWKALRSEGSGYYDTVEPPLSPTSLQWPLFLTDSQYNDSCLNNRHLSTTATFFCPQRRRCGEVQLYEHFHVVYIVFFFTFSISLLSVSLLLTHHPIPYFLNSDQVASPLNTGGTIANNSSSDSEWNAQP